MPVSVDLQTDLPTDRDEIALFSTPRPGGQQERLRDLAGRFGLRGEGRDVGYGVVYEDRRGTLELFAASDSVRWTRPELDVDEGTAAVELPEGDAAVAIAEAFLEERGLLDRERGAVESVRPNEVVRQDPEGREESFATAVQVNYRYALEGLPLLGPGAKAQVTIAARGEVAEAYRFWREPVAEGGRALIPAERALEVLVGGPAFAQLEEGRARLTVEEVRLGLYARPPREVQGYLIPAYEVRATLSTPELERYPFLSYVVAVEYRPEEAKRLGVVGRAGRSVF